MGRMSERHAELTATGELESFIGPTTEDEMIDHRQQEILSLTTSRDSMYRQARELIFEVGEKDRQVIQLQRENARLQEELIGTRDAMAREMERAAAAISDLQQQLLDYQGDA